jgi:hypothetical protein
MAILGVLICICLIRMSVFQDIIDEIDLRRDFPNLYRPDEFVPSSARAGADLQLLADLHLNTPGDVLADKPGVDVD